MVSDNDLKSLQKQSTLFLSITVIACFLLAGLAVYIGFVLVIREQGNQREMRLKAAEKLGEIGKTIELDPPPEYPRMTYPIELPETRPANIETESPN